VVRFAVGRSDGPQSTIWRLWTQGSDVYLAPRAVARRWKISFHEGGRCHWGFESEDALTAAAEPAALAQSTSRFPDIWQMPAPFAPGWTRAFTIVVPSSELRRPLRRREDGSVVWLNSPADAPVVNFAVLFGPPDALSPEDVPVVRGAPCDPVFGAVLDNGSTLWLTAYAEVGLSPATAELLEHTRAQLGDTKKHPKGARLHDPVGFSFGVVNDDGGRFYLEVATRE